MKIPEKFVVIQAISQGKHGEVFLCKNTHLAYQQEAVKLIKFKGKKEEEIAKELSESLFESSVLAYLKQSPYIINIYDAVILSDGFRISMEYLEEGSLQDLLNKHTVISNRQIIKISECVLHALEHAHIKGIFHLDVKPGNVLIKNANIYKLTDFGLSNIKGKDNTADFKKIYTAHYPPEEVSSGNKKATEQTDIYMFGVTIYRLLNGDIHFVKQGATLSSVQFMSAITTGKFPNRQEYSYHVHKKLKKIANQEPWGKPTGYGMQHDPRLAR